MSSASSASGADRGPTQAETFPRRCMRPMIDEERSVSPITRPDSSGRRTLGIRGPCTHTRPVTPSAHTPKEGPPGGTRSPRTPARSAQPPHPLRPMPIHSSFIIPAVAHDRGAHHDRSPEDADGATHPRGLIDGVWQAEAAGGAVRHRRRRYELTYHLPDAHNNAQLVTTYDAPPAEALEMTTPRTPLPHARAHRRQQGHGRSAKAEAAEIVSENAARVETKTRRRPQRVRVPAKGCFRRPSYAEIRAAASTRDVRFPRAGARQRHPQQYLAARPPEPPRVGLPGRRTPRVSAARVELARRAMKAPGGRNRR